MERKQSIVAAGIVTGVLLVGSAAYAVTAGFLTGSTGDGAGTLEPVIATSVLPSSTSTSVLPSPSSTPAATHDDAEDRAHQEGRDDDD
jgi:hypothetical protein